MGTLHLVRHGQASFGAADYDQLSELGARQCQALGRHFAARGLVFEAVLHGTLRRHRQSLDGIQAGYVSALASAQAWASLNEYDHEALVRALPQTASEPATQAASQAATQAATDSPTDARSPERYRRHFRLLREGMAAWMAGTTAPAGMPSWPAWLAGIEAALDHVRSRHQGDVLLVSSGGPIATAVAQVLGAPSATVIELNLRIRNSSVTELAYTPKRHMLHTFNQLPHLEGAACADWVTYS